MSKVKTTTNSNQYDPFAMSQYNSFQPMISSGFQQNINDPFGMMGGMQHLQSQTQQNNAFFGGQQRQNVQSMLNRGIAPNSPFFSNQINRVAGAAGGANMGAYNNLLLQANQFRTQNIGAASQYSPMQTGGTQRDKTSGLGSWLPQLLAGVGAGVKTVGMAMA